MGALTPRLFCWKRAALLPTKLTIALAVLLWAPLAMAQSNLGQLLDAGAKKLSVEEFKEQVVQRVIVGPTGSGGDLEIMYATNGTVQGLGSNQGQNISMAPIFGEWTIDDNGRICTSMRIGTALGVASPGSGLLPPRCQFWFKYADQYFFSDSDSDRRARVLRRIIKQ